MHAYNNFIPLPVFERMVLNLWRCYRQTDSNTCTRKKHINFTVDTVIARPIMKHLKRLYTALQSHGRKRAGMKYTRAAVPAAKQPPSRGRKEVGPRAPTPLGGHNISSAGPGLRGDGAPRPRVGRGVTVIALGGDPTGQAGLTPSRLLPPAMAASTLPQDTPSAAPGTPAGAGTSPAPHAARRSRGSRADPRSLRIAAGTPA